MSQVPPKHRTRSDLVRRSRRATVAGLLLGGMTGTGATFLAMQGSSGAKAPSGQSLRAKPRTTTLPPTGEENSRCEALSSTHVSFVTIHQVAFAEVSSSVSVPDPATSHPSEQVPVEAYDGGTFVSSDGPNGKQTLLPTIYDIDPTSKPDQSVSINTNVRFRLEIGKTYYVGPDGEAYSLQTGKPNETVDAPEIEIAFGHYGWAAETVSSPGICRS